MCCPSSKELWVVYMATPAFQLSSPILTKLQCRQNMCSAGSGCCKSAINLQQYREPANWQEDQSFFGHVKLVQGLERDMGRVGGEQEGGKGKIGLIRPGREEGSVALCMLDLYPLPRPDPLAWINSNLYQRYHWCMSKLTNCSCSYLQPVDIPYESNIFFTSAAASQQGI